MILSNLLNLRRVNRCNYDINLKVLNTCMNSIWRFGFKHWIGQKFKFNWSCLSWLIFNVISFTLKSYCIKTSTQCCPCFCCFQFSASIHIHPPKIPVINQDVNKDYKPKQKPGNVLNSCILISTF